MNVPKTSEVTSRSLDHSKVAIVGAGSWGTAIARVIAENHPELEVVIWAREKEVVRSINERHVNAMFLPQVTLPSNVVAVSSQREALLGSYAILLATPSRVIYDFSQKLKKHLPGNAYLGYLSKGFCRVHNEILTISQTIEKVIPSVTDGLTAICGPSHAEEVSNRYNTTLNVASRSERSRKEFSRLLQSSYLECRETDDIIGVDLGSTLKNPAAIAAGMLSMLPACGDNISGSLISEALKEMLALGQELGARDETILGIAGLGDMVATALSKHSRNRRFGKDIASQIQRRGSSIRFYDRMIMRFKPEQVIEKMSQRLHYLAEGAYAIEPIIELAESRSIKIPVYRSLYEVLLNKRDSQLLVETVKNPAKFDELYGSAKIQTREKKKGMEQASADLFENVVVERTFSRLNNPEYREHIIASGELMARLMENACVDHTSENSTAKLYARIADNNFNEYLPKIIKLHYRNMSDRYSSIISRIMNSLLWLYSIYVKIRSGESVPFKTVLVDGEIESITKVGKKSTIVYSLEGSYGYNALYVMMAFSRYPDLPRPRIFMDERGIRSNLFKYLLRKSGMYMICPDKLASPVYREVVFQYLCTMVEHGVSVCYIHSGKNESTGDGALLEHMIELIQTTTEEIAIVPLSITFYMDREGSVEYKANEFPATGDVLVNQGRLYMASPLILSDFSHAEQALIDVKNQVHTRRLENLSMYEQHILAYVLKSSNYTITSKEARKEVSELLVNKIRGCTFTPRRIVSRGMNFFQKNSIASLENGVIRVVDREAVDRYASHLHV